MTPKREAALQWFYDQGEIECAVAHKEMPCSFRMMDLLMRDRQLHAYKLRGVWHFSLTDRGRRALHGA